MLTPEELKIAQDVKGKGGTKDDAMYIIEQMRTKKPTVTPTQPQTYQKRYFSDEQKVVDQMKGEGYDDTIARQTIENRRKDILGDTKLNKDEAQMLIKMADAGIPSTKAVEGLNAFRSDTIKKQWENMNPLQKVGKTYFDFVVGTLAGGVGEVGGVTDFLTGGKSELGKMGMEARDYNAQQSQGIAGKAGRLFGEGVIDYSLAKGVGKVPLGKGVTVASKAGLATMSPTVVGRALQGAKAGALYGGLAQVGQKGAETTTGDITQGAVIGGAIGGVAGPVLEKAVIPAISKVVQKGMKYGKAGMEGGITGVGKSIGRDVQKFGQTIPTGKTTLTRTVPEMVVKKDLGFTPTQRAKIEKILGKTESQYVLEKGLAGKGKEELAQIFGKQADDAYNSIGQQLKNIKAAPVQSKSATEALQDILDQLNSNPKIQRAYANDIMAVENMLKRGQYTLDELNNIRRAFDKVNTGMYTAKGQVRSGIESAIDVEIRNSLQKQLQDEAIKYGVDVKAINKELRAGIEMKDALLQRLSQEERNNFIGLQDLGVSSILSGGNPISAVATIGAKKYAEKLAPGLSQKLYNLNKTQNVSSRLTRGNPITPRNKSSKLGLTSEPMTYTAKPQPVKPEIKKPSINKDKIYSIDPETGEGFTKDGKSLGIVDKRFLKDKNIKKKPQINKPQTLKKELIESRIVDSKGLEEFKKNMSTESKIWNDIQQNDRLQSKIIPDEYGIGKITSYIEYHTKIKGKTEQIKKIVSDFIKREGTKWKEKIGDLLDEVATKIGAKLNFISDKGTWISGKIEAPKELIEEARKYKSARDMFNTLPYEYRRKLDDLGVYSQKHYEDFYKNNILNKEGNVMYRGQSKPGKDISFNNTKFLGKTDGGVFFSNRKESAQKYGDNIIEIVSNKSNTVSKKEIDNLQKMATKQVEKDLKNGVQTNDVIEQMALGRPKAFAKYTKKPFVETWDMFGEPGEMIFYKEFNK